MQFITTGNRIAVENFTIGDLYTITFTNGNYINSACIGIGANFVTFQRNEPELLFSLTMETAELVSTIDLYAGGSGTNNYNELTNKPQINSVELVGNKSLAALGIQPEITEESPLSSELVSGLGSAAAAETSDFATAAQGALAASAVQPATMDAALALKQDALSSAQLAAVNSGITSADVAQITTNKNNILWANNYGYKNLIKRTKAEIKAANPSISWTGDTSNVVGGLTFTINDDLSITINGTTTATVIEFNLQTRTEGKTLFKQVGEYRIDGKMQTGYGMFAANRTVGSSGVRYGADEGETATFTVEQSDLSAPVGIWWGYNGVVGKVFDNITIYPMICLSTMDRTYQPYCPSNYELYQMILAL